MYGLQFPRRTESCFNWLLLGLVLLSDCPVTRSLQQREGVVQNVRSPKFWGAAEGTESLSASSLSSRRSPGTEVKECALCTTQASSSAPRCRCRQYNYMMHGKTKRFYNIEQCSGVIQVPNFTLACTDTILEVSFNGNRLGSIPGGAFRGLSLVRNRRYLSELKLSNVSLSYLDPAAFEGIQGTLHVLDLSDNQLKTLPEAIIKLHGLQRLLFSNNALNLESLEKALLTTREKVNESNRNSSLNFDDVKVIDLSHNELRGLPDLRPLTANSSKLEELRLHGNPISEDLSTFVPLLIKHKKLQKLTWPLSTVTCSCRTMVLLAMNIYADFNFPVIYPRGQQQQDDSDFMEWGAVSCDNRSVPAFIDRPIGLLSDQEVRRECLEWLEKNMKTESSIAPAGSKPDGYDAIKSNTATASGGRRSAGAGMGAECLPLVALISLAEILLLSCCRW